MSFFNLMPVGKIPSTQDFEEESNGETESPCFLQKEQYKDQQLQSSS